MSLEQFLADANTYLNSILASLSSNNPFAGNRYLITALSGALGLSAAYLGVGAVFSGLALALKGTLYGLAISYFSKNPNILADLSDLSHSVLAFIQNPAEQGPLFAQSIQNFITAQWSHLIHLVQGQRQLFANPLRENNDIYRRLNTAFNHIAVAALMTALAYSTFFATAAILIKAIIVIQLAAMSLYLLDVRTNPRIWNENLNALVVANSLEHKFHLVNNNTASLLSRKIIAFSSFLQRQHFPAPQGEGEPALEPAVLNEIPIELHQFARATTMLFSTAQQAVDGIRRAFVPGPGGNR